MYFSYVYNVNFSPSITSSWLLALFDPPARESLLKVFLTSDTEATLSEDAILSTSCYLYSQHICSDCVHDIDNIHNAIPTKN